MNCNELFVETINHLSLRCGSNRTRNDKTTVRNMNYQYWFQMVCYITGNRSRHWLIWIVCFQPIIISDLGSEMRNLESKLASITQQFGWYHHWEQRFHWFIIIIIIWSLNMSFPSIEQLVHNLIGLKPIIQ